MKYITLLVVLINCVRLGELKKITPLDFLYGIVAVDMKTKNEASIQIQGTIKDSSSNPIANAILSLRFSQNLISRDLVTTSTTTDANGAYKLNIKIGNFSVRVTNSSGLEIGSFQIKATSTTEKPKVEAITGNLIIVVNTVSVPGSNLYSIGGIVSGLINLNSLLVKNDGLSLILNNSEKLPISINTTSFSFNVLLGTNTNYNVEVNFNPVAQLCTASNNKGTVLNDNISNIRITCSKISSSGSNKLLQIINKNTKELLAEEIVTAENYPQRAGAYRLQVDLYALQGIISEFLEYSL